MYTYTYIYIYINKYIYIYLYIYKTLAYIGTMYFQFLGTVVIHKWKRL